MWFTAADIWGNTMQGKRLTEGFGLCLQPLGILQVGVGDLPAPVGVSKGEPEPAALVVPPVGANSVLVRDERLVRREAWTGECGTTSSAG